MKNVISKNVHFLKEVGIWKKRKTMSDGLGKLVLNYH